MIPRRRAEYLLSTLVCLLGCNQSGPSGSNTASDPADTNAPEQLVASIEKTLVDLPAYRCKLKIDVLVHAQGTEQHMTSEYSVKVAKPNRWAIVLDSGMMGGTSVSNGQTLTSYLPMMKRYSVEEFPENWSEKSSDMGPSRGLNENFMVMGPAGFSRLFLGDHLREWLLHRVTKSELLATATIDGLDYQQAEFHREDGTRWQIAVSTEPQPLIRRLIVVPDFSGQAQQMGQMFENLKIELRLDFTDWNTAPEFSDDTFVFHPPSGAEKVDSLMSAFAIETPPHPMLGQPAPTFETEDLQGVAFKLDEHFGKHVVMLDFWATWCTPCIEALPQVMRVASDLEDKGVVFFAVNQGEQVDRIRAFLDREQLDIPVLLDTDSKIGALYQVDSIPQTVIIGKDGRVQVVHVGFSSNMSEQLTKQLQELLEGEDLATETLQEFAEKEK